MPQDGTHVDYAAGAGFAHFGDGVFAAVEWRCGGLRLGLLPRAAWWFPSRVARGEPAGVVDRPSLVCCGVRMVSLIRAAHWDSSRTSTGWNWARWPSLRIAAADFSPRSCWMSARDYGGACGGGLAGAGEADALGGAGNDDYFVLEAIGHGRQLEEFNTGKGK